MQDLRRRTRLALTSASLLAALSAACGGGESSAPSDRGSVFMPGEPGDAMQPGAPAPGDTSPSPAPGDQSPGEPAPGDLPLDMSPPVAGEPGVTDPLAEPSVFERPTRGSTNLFTELLGIPPAEVDQKVLLARDRIFGIGTGEPTQPPAADQGYRVYYQLPQDPSMAFIWAADSNDIRSEGMSYGMMIALQLDMQEEFDNLWRFATRFMQYPADTDIPTWRYYFRWQGSVNTANANEWQVNYAANTGPAPDGDEYFAAALYLANRRWGSAGGINYLEEANKIADAMLNNQPDAQQRVPIINAQANQVVFYPQGGAANYSDPSYHLPAFYELFAQDGDAANSARWRQIAEVSRQYFVDSAHPATGLHPDYASFTGVPEAGGDRHDEFRYDAWRVVMNMAMDHVWTGPDERLETQIEKYHTFFTDHIGPGNVTNSLFQLDGSGAEGNGSTALTATLAVGSFVSDAPNRAQFVQNLWDVQQQSGLYRYYQETVYMLGLLNVAGLYGFEFAGGGAQ